LHRDGTATNISSKTARFAKHLRESPRYGRCVAKATTPWGQTEVLEELTVPQRAGEKRFATIIQLLSDARGDELVRFAYSTGGTARRGPVTLRARDLERLRSALAEHPGLARALAPIEGKE
jgi:hypothetical protein